jgi:hypothetical protein
MNRSVKHEVLWSAAAASVLAAVFVAVNVFPIPIVEQIAVFEAVALSGNPHSPSVFLIWLLLALMLWVPFSLIAVIATSLRLAMSRHQT